ncbi:MAG: hypothetical protein HC767_13395 [Akkermansiaceae bacterium]|nr:hypothetical protein [Akkermansiaceae bacterium]
MPQIPTPVYERGGGIPSEAKQKEEHFCPQVHYLEQEMHEQGLESNLQIFPEMFHVQQVLVVALRYADTIVQLNLTHELIEIFLLLSSHVFPRFVPALRSSCCDSASVQAGSCVCFDKVRRQHLVMQLLLKATKISDDT